MPELPEVETVARALRPHIVGKTVARVVARRAKLRDVIPDLSLLVGQRVLGTARRSKYLKIQFASGDVVVHLGMSGVLSWLPTDTEPGRHDHWDMVFTDGSVVRLRDPRRFGAVLWQAANTTHPAFAHLGPEPLDTTFDGAQLQSRIGKKRSPIKTVIMDASVVVGVGNIYANEALFHAHIDPRTQADALGVKECVQLVAAIKHVLQEGIRLGGATVRDYRSVDGSNGEFATTMQVYGRAKQACFVCGSAISSVMMGGRNTFWCPKCQHTLPAKPRSQKTVRQKPSNISKRKQKSV